MTHQLVRYLALVAFFVLMIAGTPLIVWTMLSLGLASYILNTAVGLAYGGIVTTLCLLLWMKGDE